MQNVLVILKSILNGFSDEELRKHELWINNESEIEAIIVDDTNSISLITNTDSLKINGKDW